MAAVDLAIRLQFGGPKANDYVSIMEGAATATPPGLDFDRVKMQSFLQAVSRRLRWDTPVLVYDWTKTDVTKCLNANRDQLVDLIVKDTTLAAGDG